MARGETFIKNAKWKHGHRSAMSSLTWCDLNKNRTALKLHDMRHNPKCNCQKQLTFTPNCLQLDGGSMKIQLKSIFKRTQTA